MDNSLSDLVDELLLSIQAVCDIHRKGGLVDVKAGYPYGWCEHDKHPWPCPTIRALTRAN